MGEKNGFSNFKPLTSVSSEKPGEMRLEATTSSIHDFVTDLELRQKRGHVIDSTLIAKVRDSLGDMTCSDCTDGFKIEMERRLQTIERQNERLIAERQTGKPKGEDKLPADNPFSHSILLAKVAHLRGGSVPLVTHGKSGRRGVLV